MKNKFTLNIPNPCSADWNQMNSSDKGRFCLACQTTVIDFSTLDEAAIKEFFRNHTGKVCGRFQADQLKEYTLPARRRSVLAFLSVIGLTSFLVLIASLSKPPETFIQAKPILPMAKQKQTDVA